MTARVRTTLSIGVTLVLLVLVLRKVGLHEVAAAIRGADVRMIVLASIIGQITFAPKVYNWQQLLRAQGHEVSYLSLYRLYFVGLFFNNLLPTNVGGDVVRSYEVGRHIGDQATGLATVFVERLTGLMVLVILAVAAFLTHLEQIHSGLLAFAVFSALFGLAAVTWVAFDSAVLDFVIRSSPAPIARQLRRLKKVQTALHRYRGHRRLFVNSFVLSLMFNTAVFLYMYVSVLAFQHSVSLLGIFFVVPITTVVGMTPLTFNGVGLQEWACVLLFPQIGVAASVGLSAMLLIRGITLFSSVMGALFYMHLKTQRPTAGGPAAGVVGVEPSSVTSD